MIRRPPRSTPCPWLPGRTKRRRLSRSTYTGPLPTSAGSGGWRRIRRRRQGRPQSKRTAPGNSLSAVFLRNPFRGRIPGADQLQLEIDDLAQEPVPQFFATGQRSKPGFGLLEPAQPAFKLSRQQLVGQPLLRVRIRSGESLLIALQRLGRIPLILGE